MKPTAAKKYFHTNRAGFIQPHVWRAIAVKFRKSIPSLSFEKSITLRKSGAGFTLTETLITGALIGVLVVIGTMLLSMERARTRDAQRLSDMTRIASGFALLYAEKASYADAAAGCPKVGDPASACALTDVLPGLATVKDPGRFSYTVSKVPDRDNFGIRFRLERRYGALGAGVHTLTKNGIQ